MRNMQLQTRNTFAFLAVATFLWVGPPTLAQSPQDNPPARQDDDRSRGEVASFDQFLGSHRQISEELRGDPARIRNSGFLQQYPELQAFLQSHPAVQQQLTANPNEFMRAVERRDYQQQFGPGSTRRDPDVTRRELASFDRFLDGHQQISQELRGDPSRIRNSGFLQQYPELEAYLQSHPAVRAELNENPNSFMWAENNYDYREQQRNRANSDRTPTIAMTTAPTTRLVRATICAVTIATGTTGTPTLLGTVMLTPAETMMPVAITTFAETTTFAPTIAQPTVIARLCEASWPALTSSSTAIAKSVSSCARTLRWCVMDSF